MACLTTTRTWIDRGDLTTATLTMGFDGSSGFEWATATTGGTTSADTTNYCYAPVNSQALKVTASGAGTAKVTQTISSTDLTGHMGSLECFFPAGSLTDGTYPSWSGWNDGVLMYVYDSSNNWAFCTLASPNQDILEGWKSLAFNLASPDGTSGTPPDMSDIVKIDIRTVFGAAGSITYDKLTFYAPHTKGRLFVRFDDGYDDAYTYSITGLNYGIKSNLLIIGDAIGTSTYMTLANLQELHAAGCKVINHLTSDVVSSNGGSVTGWRFLNSSNNTLATQSNIITAINANAAQLCAWNMPEHAWFVGVPGGSTHPSDESLITNGVCRALWYAGAGQPATRTSNNQVNARGDYDWGIRTGLLMDGVASATVQARIQECIDDKGDLTIYGHSTVVDWETTCAFIQAALQAGTLEIGTADDLVTPVGTTNLIQSGTGSIGGAGFGIGA